jgi:hypothetical protein
LLTDRRPIETLIFVFDDALGPSDELRTRSERESLHVVTVPLFPPIIDWVVTASDRANDRGP